MGSSGRPPGSIVPRSKYLVIIALVTLVIGLLQATNTVQFPFGAWFSRLTGSLLSAPSLNDFMSKYGYASLFILMALESASLPVPSEVVLPLAGYFVRQGALSFWPAVGVSTAASLAGALFDYYLAISLGRPVVVELLKLLRIHKGALDRAEGWFKRSGEWTVFVARFVPGLRTIISLPAGLFEMEITRFVAMTVAGCFAWSVLLVYAGVLAGSPSSSEFASSPTVVVGLSVILAALSAAYIGYYVYGAFRRSEGRATHPTSVS